MRTPTVISTTDSTVINTAIGGVGVDLTPYDGVNVVATSISMTTVSPYWRSVGALTKTTDQFGIYEEPNRATLLHDYTSSGFLYTRYSHDIGAANSQTWAARLFVNKIASGGYPLFGLGFSNNLWSYSYYNPTIRIDIGMDPDTGAYFIDQNSASGSVIIREYAGDTAWWEVLIQATNAGYNHVDLGVFPAGYLVWGGATSGNAVGAIIIGNNELYANTLIADISGGPVFTE